MSMIATILLVLLLVAILLGAIGGGKDFGDVIRRGLNILLTLIVLAIAAYLIYVYWDVLEPFLQTPASEYSPTY